MGRDFLDAGNFSPKERAILTRAAQILEAKVRAGSVALNSPALVREWLALQFSGLEREVFGVIYLDAQNRLIDFEALFTGTLTQTSVYPREVVKAALARNAAAVMFAHFVAGHKMAVMCPAGFCGRLAQVLVLVGRRPQSRHITRTAATGCAKRVQWIGWLSETSGRPRVSSRPTAISITGSTASRGATDRPATAGHGRSRPARRAASRRSSSAS